MLLWSEQLHGELSWILVDEKGEGGSPLSCCCSCLQPCKEAKKPEAYGPNGGSFCKECSDDTAGADGNLSCTYTLVKHTNGVQAANPH